MNHENIIKTVDSPAVETVNLLTVSIDYMGSQDAVLASEKLQLQLPIKVPL